MVGDDEENCGPTIDLAPLIATLKSEGVAYRSEEQREDRSKKLREWLTIGLLFLTMIAIFWQVQEMIKVYGPVKEQAEATKRAAEAATRQSEIATKQAEASERAAVQAQRAWVGPQNASFATEPVAGKPVDITLTYQNTGRQPALGFTYLVEVFAVTTDEDQRGVASGRMARGLQQCKSTEKWSGGSVIYPSTGSGNYTLFVKSKDDFVDDAVVKGNKMVVVQGCFLYRTFERPHHSYFCYFFKGGQTKIQNLNICNSGHDAD
jgi:hypothetical protein